MFNLSKYIVIFVTYKCNWFCTYCITNTHIMKEPKYEDVIKQAESVPDNFNVYISGGEPGLLQDEKMFKILSILKNKNCNIKMFTNGLFFNLKKSKQLVDECIYHCSENLDTYVDAVNTEEMYSLKCNIVYSIVVSETNKHNLGTFLEMNKHIKFHVNGADNNDTLNKIDGIKIWTKYKNQIKRSSKVSLMNHYKYNKEE